jgi:hypothetical protein
MLMFADMLPDGITKQFPDKVQGTKPPGVGVVMGAATATVDLGA